MYTYIQSNGIKVDDYGSKRVKPHLWHLNHTFHILSSLWRPNFSRHLEKRMGTPPSVPYLEKRMGTPPSVPNYPNSRETPAIFFPRNSRQILPATFSRQMSPSEFIQARLSKRYISTLLVFELPLTSLQPPYNHPTNPPTYLPIYFFW